VDDRLGWIVWAVLVGGLCVLMWLNMGCGGDGMLPLLRC
jgi:hypothetical protein